MNKMTLRAVLCIFALGLDAAGAFQTPTKLTSLRLTTPKATTNGETIKMVSSIARQTTSTLAPYRGDRVIDVDVMRHGSYPGPYGSMRRASSTYGPTRSMRSMIDYDYNSYDNGYGPSYGMRRMDRDYGYDSYNSYGYGDDDSSYGYGSGDRRGRAVRGGLMRSGPMRNGYSSGMMRYGNSYGGRSNDRYDRYDRYDRMGGMSNGNGRYDRSYDRSYNMNGRYGRGDMSYGPMRNGYSGGMQRYGGGMRGYNGGDSSRAYSAGYTDGRRSVGGRYADGRYGNSYGGNYRMEGGRYGSGYGNSYGNSYGNNYNSGYGNSYGNRFRLGGRGGRY